MKLRRNVYFALLIGLPLFSCSNNVAEEKAAREAEEVHEAKAPPASASAAEAVEEPAGPSLSPVNVHVSDEPPPYEMPAREPAVVFEAEAKEVVEAKAGEAPASDALSYMPGRVSQLIADYARVETHWHDMFFDLCKYLEGFGRLTDNESGRTFKFYNCNNFWF
jgi:hypothetical protein